MIKKPNSLVSKYLFEFIVVFSGLLLSFTIDNYNKKIDKIETKNLLLSELKQSIKSDLKQLDIVNKSLNDCLNSIELLLDNRDKDKSFTDSLIAYHVSNISAKMAISFFPQKGIYNQLIYSNSLELIQNSKLRGKIIDLYEHLEDRKSASDLKNDLFIESFDQAILDKIYYRIKILEVDNSVDLNTRIVDYKVEESLLVDAYFLGYIVNAEKRVYYYKELLKKYFEVMTEISVILEQNHDLN